MLNNRNWEPTALQLHPELGRREQFCIFGFLSLCAADANAFCRHSDEKYAKANDSKCHGAKFCIYVKV